LTCAIPWELETPTPRGKGDPQKEGDSPKGHVLGGPGFHGFGFSFWGDQVSTAFGTSFGAQSPALVQFLGPVHGFGQFWGTSPRLWPVLGTRSTAVDSSWDSHGWDSSWDSHRWDSLGQSRL